MFCVHCGTALSDGAAFCPECGTPQKTNDAAQQTACAPQPDDAARQKAVEKAPTNLLAILGLVISGISLLLNFWGIVGIAGTIVSTLGLLQCKRRRERGKTLAIVGIVVGGYSIIYGVVMLLSLL